MPITKHEITDDGHGSTRYRYWAIKDGERHIASCDVEADADRIVEALTWIKCSDRLPNPNDSVLIYYSEDHHPLERCVVAYHTGRYWIPPCSWMGTNPTYWRPLPPTPKGGA